MTNFHFKVTNTENLPPDNEKTADIFSRLGYKISDAIADLVDNSVDEEARNIHIRFVRGTDGIHNVIIADNGNGMSDEKLREAMRFGSRSSKSEKQLGKYGIGLKSASLSQAETVTVLTRQGKSVIGRRWTLENVRNNWSCDILQVSDVQKALNGSFGEFRINKSGTVIIWERLEHLKALPNNIDRILEKTIHELKIELGIRFHRFIESGRLEISIDQQFGLEEPTGILTYVEALNPFSYEQSGHRDYPITFELNFDGICLDVECHIWPPKVNPPGYRLGGGKVALRQGFYFYRNDRIIQAGGWNGIRVDDGEPHLSLARVKVDLPATLDSMFKLDVTKSRLDPSPNFTNALQLATTKDKTFKDYIEQAELTYRKQKTKDGAKFPLVPGTGLPTKTQRKIATILAEKGTDRPKKVSFKWSRLDHDQVFRLDAKRDEIHLNTRYKKYLVEGSASDAPILKLVLMFLFKHELEKSFATKKSLDWVQKVNSALLAAME